MRFKWTFPAELKGQLDSAMKIEKEAFEKKGKSGFIALNMKVINKASEMVRRFGGKTGDFNIPFSWEYEFVSDTEMLLDIVSPLDQIIAFISILSVQGMAEDSRIIKWLKKKLKLNTDKDIEKKKAEALNERNRMLLALRRYSDPKEGGDERIKVVEVAE